ncbi:MAG: sugar phosphate isomerase/epimerase family protein [Candidatus Brocadiia bacterium]
MAESKMPVGVFASAGAGLGAALEKVLELEVPTAQLHVPGPEERTREHAQEVAQAFADAGVEVSLVFCGFAGDRYDTIQVVRETVGLVPPDTRAERLEAARGMADFAAWLGAPGIGIHVGFVSEDWHSPEFAAIVEAVSDLAGHCESLGLTMNLETGQETADTLLHLLQTVDRENLRVNFDPANMILYGSGQPMPALRKVSDYVSSVHCKDAVWSDNPGEDFGREVPLGEGDVDISRFIATLAEIGYEGPLTIEREVSGQRQIEDIRKGIELLRRVKADLAIA